MTSYLNMSDWYWFVGGDQSRAYNSRRNIYVDPASDPGYADFLKDRPTGAVPIESEAELWYYGKQVHPAWLFDGETFSQPSEGEYTPTQLKRYSEKVRIDTAGAGMVAEDIPIATDTASQQRITNGRIAAESDNQYSTTIIGTDGVNYPADAAKCIALSDAFLAHATDLADVDSELNALIDSGAVTTLKQIEDGYSTLVRRKIKDGRSNHYHRK